LSKITYLINARESFFSQKYQIFNKKVSYIVNFSYLCPKETHNE
jgi:hypothetical protein